jgi:hypothetical protein
LRVDVFQRLGVLEIEKEGEERRPALILRALLKI